MIKFKKLPSDILQLLPDAVEYLESHPQIVFAYLFGSLARGKPQPLSDVDIAIYLRTGGKVAERKLEILGNLVAILQTDEIDLVVLNTAALSLVMNIVKARKIIVDKDPFSRHIFESVTMRKYFDFSIKESAMLQRRYLHG
jgi:predicted nucleotidyltransferase